MPQGLPPVFDAHVHVFPDRLFAAVRRWFDQHGWTLRYRLSATEVLEFLRDRGVAHVLALQYSHKPGMAKDLNAWMAELCVPREGVSGLATVLPGEPGAAAILEEGFAQGLIGVKLHCHVQCFSPGDRALAEIYEVCASAGKPLVMHAGREPKSPAYGCDPHELCSADRVERVLAQWPSLKLVVPHLGADELDEYGRLLVEYENLWLDTTMAVGGFFPLGNRPLELVRRRPDRIMFGTDFPNIPYSWDRELVTLAEAGLTEVELNAVLGGTARSLFAVAPGDLVDSPKTDALC